MHALLDLALAAADPVQGDALEAVQEEMATEPYEEGGYGAWYESTNLWVLVAFLVVLGIFLWQSVHKRITGALTSRAEDIRTQLDEARNLREEAQRLLASYQKRQREAEEEAAAIVDQAKADAKVMLADARKAIEEQTERRSKAAHDRIARAEAQAIADIRGQTADLAVSAARRIIADRMDPAAAQAYNDKAIADVGSRLG